MASASGGEYAAPLFAGYENQIIQLAATNSNSKEILKDVTVLYPSPTIYSDHPILALDTDGWRLISAMRDDEIQKIAWKKYGFRSTTNAGINTTSTFNDLPLASRVRTIPATNADVTQALMSCLTDAKKCS